MVLRQRAARKIRQEELHEGEETQPPKRRQRGVSSNPSQAPRSKRSSRPQTSPPQKENSATVEVVVPLSPFSIEDLLIEAANRRSNSTTEQSSPGAHAQKVDSLLTSEADPAATLTSSVGEESCANPSLERFLKGVRRLDLFPPSGDPVPGPNAVKAESPSSEPAQPHTPGQTQNEAIEKMDTAIKSLSKLESEVMSALFPTDGSIPQSYELIASRFGMTVEEVKGIADNALRGLRGTRGPNGRISTAWN